MQFESTSNKVSVTVRQGKTAKVLSVYGTTLDSLIDVLCKSLGCQIAQFKARQPRTANKIEKSKAKK